GRRLHLLRPALPRGLARAGARGRADRLQPVGHQPGSVVPPVEARTARGRGGQRVLRRRDQPGGRGGVRRQRLLRHQLLRRPARPVRRRRRERERRGAPRPRPGPRPDRRGAPAVGVLPRPPTRRLRTAGGSMSLLDRTRAVLPSWLAIYYEDPIEIERGEGRHVWDTHGHAYLDFFGGILTTMTAHALPEVTKAVSEQAGRIIHSSTLYLNRPMGELAEQIATVSAIPDAKVFLTTSGTEANDAALLLASSLRRSNQILALRNSYHGRSFSTIAITGNRSWSPTSLSPFQTYYVHGGQQYRSPFAGLPDGEFIAACVADLREVLDQAGGDVAALIAEPIQGVGGFTSGPDGLLGAFAEVLREKGILWI